MHYDQPISSSLPLPSAGPTATTTSHEGFPKFLRLPPEIRNMIWEFALPEGRVYEVLDAPGATTKTPATQGLMFANVHAEPPPALAAVCRESRSFVLHHYRPLTLGRTTKFVDLSRDMLLLEPYLLVKRLHRVLRFLGQIELVREHMTRLALGTSYGVYTGLFHPVLGNKVAKGNMAKLLAEMGRFRRLHTLVFVVHQEFQFEFDFRFPGTLTPMPPGYSPGVQPGMNGLPSTSSSNGQSLSTTTTPSHTSLPGTTPLSRPLPPWPLAQPHAILQPMSLAPPPPPPPPPSQYQQPPQQVHQAYRFKFDIESNINTPPRRPHTNELLYYPLEEIPRELDEFDAYEAYVNSQSAAGSRRGSSAGTEHRDGSCSGDVSARGCCSCCWCGGSGSGIAGLGLQQQQQQAAWWCAGSGGGAGIHEAKRWDYCLAAVAASASNDEDDNAEDSEWRDPWPTNEDWRRFRRRWVRAMVAACLPPHGQVGVGEREGEEEEAGWAGTKAGRGCAVTTTATVGSGSGRGEKGAAGAGKGRGKGRMTLPKWRIKGASLLWRYTKGVPTGRG
ncbi:hypothetical protein VTJ04DRAFT_3546 [Mycothermus thermophilus]|uniref:uncharacterized protein n=1 Tax=Humicola insolens TaxID=85995 RepID=UPI0037445B53